MYFVCRVCFVLNYRLKCKLMFFSSVSDVLILFYLLPPNINVLVALNLCRTVYDFPEPVKLRSAASSRGLCFTSSLSNKTVTYGKINQLHEAIEGKQSTNIIHDVSAMCSRSLSQSLSTSQGLLRMTFINSCCHALFEMDEPASVQMRSNISSRVSAAYFYSEGRSWCVNFISTLLRTNQRIF